MDIIFNISQEYLIPWGIFFYLSTLNFILGPITNSDIINEYFIEFTTSSSGTTVSLPSTIKWANGEKPTFEASTTYQISIINNLGVVIKFK